MGQSSIIKVTLTGAQIKALMTNPSANTEETIRVVSGLAGASVSDYVIISSMFLQTTVQPGLTLTMTPEPTNPYNGLELDSSGLNGSPYNGKHKIAGGNLDGLFKVYDSGTHLSDIADSFSMDLYIQCALVTSSPGINADAQPMGYYAGTIKKANPIKITKSGTVSSGTAIFHLTSDGNSTGTALFPNGPDLNTVVPFVNDANASYQFGWVWSNSNKTLTVTVNKFTTANILSGILGQAAANGSTCTVSVWGS